MYFQMGHTDLIAYNISQYIQIAVRLLHDDEYWTLQSNAVSNGFKSYLHKNSLVSEEWLNFFARISYGNKNGYFEY